MEVLSATGLMTRLGRLVPGLWCSGRLRLYDWLDLFAEGPLHGPKPEPGRPLDPTDRLTPEGVAGAEEGRRERRAAWLRAQLRRWPYWEKGHRELAVVCFSLEQVESAYPSALAWMKLLPAKSPQQAEAHHFLGKCFLKRGDPKGALRELAAAEGFVSPGPEFRLRSAAILEDKGAAFMALGDYEQARKCIDGIPEDLRSAQLRAAAEFLSASLQSR